MKLTAEQELCIDAVKETSDNLCIEARAGCAKTTTLVEMTNVAKGGGVVLAFNKDIATEVAQKISNGFVAKTLHSLGFSALRNTFRCRFSLNKNKMLQIFKEDFIPEYAYGDEEEEKKLWEYWPDIKNLCGAIKSAGHIPDGTKGTWRNYASLESILESFPQELDDVVIEISLKMIKVSLEDALEGNIDFDDMIYVAACHKSVSWETFNNVFVDESQDLSPLNHIILRKVLGRKGRLIAVGDPCQAIYGFRGADTESMANMVKMFEMKTLYLTVCFRCPTKVIEAARWRAPDMIWPEGTKEGFVNGFADWDSSNIDPGAAIICRYNAPLFPIAIDLLKQRIGVKLSARELLTEISKVMKTFGRKTSKSEAAMKKLEKWKETGLSKARPGAEAQIHDRYEIMKLFIEEKPTLGEAMDYFTEVMSSEGSIKLMTGHKAKGLEFEQVFFLDQHRCDIEKDQDANIKYVIQTRALSELNYVTSEGWSNGAG